MNALRVFEVTARAGSYTEAARELHLTHGAVSRQIQLLEQSLGQKLFRREGQRMVPTAHAKAFAREISAAFDHISDAAARYGKRASTKVIRINAPATLAMRWLIPRLPAFRETHPGVEIRVSTALSSEPILRGSFDVAIRRTAEDKTLFEVFPLFTEHATVIASPAYVKQHRIRKLADLAKVVWLTTETRPAEWENWLASAGSPELRPVQALRFDHFFVTLQAVADGMGVGIGPLPTLGSDLQQGRIVTPFPQLVSKGSEYQVVVPHDSDKPAYFRAFLEWLAVQGG
jgi:DNA-binding transcriptional LysR family regulator